MLHLICEGNLTDSKNTELREEVIVVKKTIGFIISHKENEHRLALLPTDFIKIKNPSYLFFEENYGAYLNISDQQYRDVGAQIVSREMALQQDIICEPKLGDADFLHTLKPHQTLFGWIHAEQNKQLSQLLIAKELKVFAWEEMFHLNRHLFWRNNELAGEAAVLHAYLLHGCLPYETKVAVIGRGNVANGAVKILQRLGAEVTVYKRNQELLLHEELGEFDVIVNALLWDNARKDYLITRADLKRMKSNALIIDVSSDYDGAIESSHPTSLEEPTFTVENICHYAVDHTPSMLYRTSTQSISTVIAPFLDDLITGTSNPILAKAEILRNPASKTVKIHKIKPRIADSGNVSSNKK